MRDYGTVSAKFWIGETGKKLRGNKDAQILALYFMTSPHASMSGLYYCPLTYMSQDTGIPIEGARKGLQKLIEEKFCEYDNEMDMIFVVKMARHQLGDRLNKADKRRIGLLKDLAKIPATYLIGRFIEVYEIAYQIDSSTFSLPQKTDVERRDIEGASKSLRSQDPDPDQDQEKEVGLARKAARPRRQIQPVEADKDRTPPLVSSKRLRAIYSAMQTEEFHVPGIGGQTMWDNCTYPRKIAEKLDTGAPGVDVPTLIRTLAGWTYVNITRAKRDLAAFVWKNAIREQDNPRPAVNAGGNYAHGNDLAAKVKLSQRGNQ